MAHSPDLRAEKGCAIWTAEAFNTVVTLCLTQQLKQKIIRRSASGRWVAVYRRTQWRMVFQGAMRRTNGVALGDQGPPNGGLGCF